MSDPPRRVTRVHLLSPFLLRDQSKTAPLLHVRIVQNHTCLLSQTQAAAADTAHIGRARDSTAHITEHSHKPPRRNRSTENPVNLSARSPAPQPIGPTNAQKDAHQQHQPHGDRRARLLGRLRRDARPCHRRGAARRRARRCRAAAGPLDPRPQGRDHHAHRQREARRHGGALPHGGHRQVRGWRVLGVAGRVCRSP